MSSAPKAFSHQWSFHLLDGGPLYPETFDVVHPMSSSLNPPKLQIQGIMEQFGMEGTLKTIYVLQFSPSGKFSPFKSCPWPYSRALWMPLQGFSQPNLKSSLAYQVWSQTKGIHGTSLRNGDCSIKLVWTLLLPSSCFVS